MNLENLLVSSRTSNGNFCSLIYFELFFGKTLNNVQGSIFLVNDIFLNFQLIGADLFLSSEYFCK